MNIEKITSNQNNHVKKWKKMQSKKGRKENQLYMLEGWHLVNEAIMANEAVTEIMVTDTNDLEQLNWDQLSNQVKVYLITSEIARHISETQTPQGIFATVKLPEFNDELPFNLHGSWVLLDGLQDPGNVGTIVRTADAAGVSGVVFGTGTVDLYNPKVVRSMQGSQFHLNIYEGDLKRWLQAFNEQQVPTFGTELNPQAVAYNQVTSPGEFALVLGNEGNGASQEVLRLTSQNLYIPMKGRAESLNVAIAGGILMFYLQN